jgi:hypothetical protein
MHDCKGLANIRLSIGVPIKATFNGNYQSGIDELQDCAVEHLISFLPREWHIEITDVLIQNYEQTKAEREAEHD